MSCKKELRSFWLHHEFGDSDNFEINYELLLRNSTFGREYSKYGAPFKYAKHYTPNNTFTDHHFLSKHRPIVKSIFHAHKYIHESVKGKIHFK